MLNSIIYPYLVKIYKTRMLVKAILILCIEATIFQASSSQCIPQPQIPIEPMLTAFEPYPAPTIPIMGRIVGGNLILDTKNPNSPGVSISSERLIIDGNVIVTGKLPFLGTVALDGIVPATGKSAVSYECGTSTLGEGFYGAYPGVLPQNGVELIGSGILSNGLPIGPGVVQNGLIAPEFFLPNGQIGAEFLGQNGMINSGNIAQNGLIGGFLPQANLVGC